MKTVAFIFSLFVFLQTSQAANPWYQDNEEPVKYLYFSKHSSSVQRVMSNFLNYKKYFDGEMNYPQSSFVLPINAVVDKNQILRFTHRVFKPKRCYKKLKKYLRNSPDKYDIQITGKNFFDWKRSQVNFHVSSPSKPSFQVTCGLNRNAVVSEFYSL